MIDARPVKRDPRIGARLKELRTVHAMTLRELAARAGVSATLLSQVERSIVDPSLDTLRRLAAAFGEPLVSLFAAPARIEVNVSRPGARPIEISVAGGVAYEKLAFSNAHLDVRRATLHPGERSADEARAQSSVRCVYVVAGTLVAEVAGVSYPLRRGEALSFDARLSHYLCNRAEEPVEFVLSEAPPRP